MRELILAAVLYAQTGGADLTREHIGPCVAWVAVSKKGEEFLKNLPARFRSPFVTVHGGAEQLTGERAEYDPETRSVMTCPALQTELAMLAANSELRVSEEK